MQAVILAAGRGRRLGRLTMDRTKCMISVNGRTLIERMLDDLVALDVSRLVLVVGYQEQGVRDLVGTNYRSVPVHYISNPDYATTNNIYSLSLAEDYLAEDDTLLLESDLIYDPKILTDLLNHPKANVAAVDRYKPWMDGTVVTLAADHSITEFIPKKHFDPGDIDRYYKTVNIYKFSRDFLRSTYLPFLSAYVAALGKNAYYEQVLRVITTLETKDLVAMPLQGELWYEIDDQEDLANAETMFADDDESLDSYSDRFGGYWRFPGVVDFAYLVNPHFPPPRLFEELTTSLKNLVTSYPSGQSVQAATAANVFGVAPETLVVGNGAAEIISALGALTQDQLTAVSLPTFGEYTARFSNVVGIRDREGDALSSSLLGGATPPETLIVVNPDNPTGACLTTDELVGLATDAQQRGVRLVLDESFVDFTDDGHCESFLTQERLEQFPNMIVIKSLGKSFGIPGLRLGVAASADSALIGQLRAALPVWNVGSLAEFFLQIFPKYADDYFSSTRKIAESRKKLTDEFKGIPGLTVLPSQANYLLCRLESPMTAREVASQLLVQHQLLVKDMSAKEGLEGQYFRFAVRTDADNARLVRGLRSVLGV